MKKWASVLLISVITGVGVSSCLKNNSSVPTCSPVPVTAAAPANEIATLKAYLDSSQITYTQDSRGFFYSLYPAFGSDTTKPTICSAVAARYRGTFLNGTPFDTSSVSTPASFYLNRVILGWQEAVPLMHVNDSMVLYIPPTLGYGSSTNGPIPANSNLKFTIKLLAFN